MLSTSHGHAKADEHHVIDGSRHTLIASKELLSAGQEIHLSTGQKIILEAGAELIFKAGGSYLKLDPSGITLVGPSINLNAGGSVGDFDVLQFGAAALKALVSFTGPKAGVPLNDRIMAERLVVPLLKQHVMQPSSSSLTSTQISLTPELIAIAGSQHDKRSGNQMMFIGQAVREIFEFKRSNPSLARTLIVFTPSYNGTMLSAARSSASAYGADFVEVTTVQELFDYLNQGKDRIQSPIEHLSLFSHGVPHSIAFGYQLVDHLQMPLDVQSYDKISPQAFSRSAQIDSYACRTGMGNRSEYPIEDGIQLFPQTNESLAQLLADHLQVKVRAFVRRSDYKNTWGTVAERQLGKLCGISDNAVPGKEWCREWADLAQERYETDKTLDFTYQTMGALNPVISGTTPFGAPGGHFEFLPK